MYLQRFLAFAVIAALTPACGQSNSAPGQAVSSVHAAVTPGSSMPLKLPAQSIRVVLEMRNRLQSQALPDASTAVVTIAGDQLVTPFIQTVTSSQFVDSTAQLVISGLNAGTYRLTAVVKASDDTVIVSGGMDVTVVAGQATDARLVLLYGTAEPTGGIGGTILDNPPPVAITAISADPAALPGTGYPARIEVTTNRADQDALSYHYSADGGTFSGSGRLVLWTAPPRQGGTYTITVQVEDGLHPPASASVSIAVPSGAGAVTGNASFADFS